MKNNKLLTISAAFMLGMGALTTHSFADDQSNTSTTIGRVNPANDILGREIVSAEGRRIGELDHIVIDLETGKVLYALVNVGRGSINGKDFIALPPGVFQRGSATDRIRLSVPLNQVRGVPHLTREVTKNLGSAEFVYKVHKHFNQNIWWAGSQGSGNTGQFNNVYRVDKLRGIPVVNVMDKKMGEVNSVLVDLPVGRVTYLVLDPGDDLNLGDKLFAMPPNMFTRHKDGRSFTADITQEKLASAPSFTRGNMPNLNDTALASRIYDYYGKQPYFDGAVQPTGRESDRIYNNPDRDYNRNSDELRDWDRNPDRDWDDRRDWDRRNRERNNDQRDRGLYDRDLDL